MRDMIVYFSLFNLTLVPAWYHGMAHYALLHRLEESACGSVNANQQNSAKVHSAVNDYVLWLCAFAGKASFCKRLVMVLS